MAKNEQGSGTIRTIKDRATGAILGYQALLPRELSKAPPGCKNPKTYQQALKKRFESEPAAREFLTAVIKEKLDPKNIVHGLPLAHYVQDEIRERYEAAVLKYEVPSRANIHVSAWRSIDRLWLSQAPFYQWTPSQIDVPALKAWFKEVRSTGKNSKTGRRLSASFIGNIGQLVKAALDQAEIAPNPMASVKLPKKDPVRVKFLTLPEQLRFYQSPQIEERDRLMNGCGMGSGLRIGELLGLEEPDLHMDAHDPHLIVRYGGDDHAPPKGHTEAKSEFRRVELFEPGLGFFRAWMQRFYRGGVRVFEGPRGGYMNDWDRRYTTAEGEGEDAIPSWSEIMGRRVTSHIVMRHTYAVAMLSGSWGYDPQSLEFIQQQLRHADLGVTQRYYGGYENGAQARQVRHFTGREPRKKAAGHVTAAALLGVTAPDVSFDASPLKSLAKTEYALDERHLDFSRFPAGKLGSSDASTHQALAALAAEVGRAIQECDPLALPRALDLARAVLRDLSTPLGTTEIAEARSEAGA